MDTRGLLARIDLVLWETEMTDQRGDAAWTDHSRPPSDIGTDLRKISQDVWAVQLEGKTTPHLWHWCDRRVRNARPEVTQDRAPGWTLAGSDAHTLVCLDPLHLEPSVFWPDCCGMHGWIRGGRWTSA